MKIRKILRTVKQELSAVIEITLDDGFTLDTEGWSLKDEDVALALQYLADRIDEHFGLI